MSPLPRVLSMLLLATVLIAAFYDIRSRRIPNWLVLGALILGVGLNAWAGAWLGLRASLLGCGLALLVYLPFWLVRGMGGGDVKLMGAIGSMTGPMNWLLLFVFTALIGGVIATVLVLSRGRVGVTLRNIGFVLGRVATLRTPQVRDELNIASANSLKMPHAVSIALGTMVFLLVQ